MKSLSTKLLLFVPALALPLLAFAPAFDKLAFAPEDGAEVTKDLNAHFELRLEDISVSAMGQEIDPQMMGDPQVTLRADHSAKLSDTYVKSAGGRPVELLRSFEELGGKFTAEYSAEGESGSQESELKSDMAGKKVQYTWNDKESRYDLAFAGDAKGNEDLLKDLDEDLDLRMLLPTQEVKQDEGWEVPSATIVKLLMPTGSFKLHGDKDGADDEEAMKFLESLDLDTDELLAKLLAGTIRATYAGTKEVDGARLAEIQLKAEIQSSNDFADVVKRGIEKMLEMQGVEERVEIALDEATLELGFKGEGVLLWDPKAGHAQSFSLSGEATVEIKIGGSVDAEGQKQSFRMAAEFSGDLGSELQVHE